MIRVSNLTKSFDNQRVLDRFNLEVAKWEIMVILGASGSGKSVLLRQLMGLSKSDSGSVEIDSVNITKLPERQLLKIRKNIGYLFQEGALYDFMNVCENIAFPLKEHTTLSPQIISAKVKKVLEWVDLKGVENKYPAELSGGMKKRVGLARAIIMDSKVLLCDEPTSGLDPLRSRDISDLIKGISRQINCTTVVTSHDIQNAFRIADRLALINNGKVVALGTQKELLHSKDQFVQEFLKAGISDPSLRVMEK